VEVTFQHYLLGIFAVGNNISALPMHMNLCKGLSKGAQHRLCSTATAASLATMAVSFLMGAAVLEFFGISIAAFRIAGGLYLATSGLGMLRSKSNGESAQTFSLSEVIPIAVVPIAIPLTSGPGVISAIILFAQEAHGLPGLLKIGAAIGAVSAINYLSFYFSPVIIRVLGHTGMDIFTKVFGLITLALGVQFILTGLSTSFPVLLH
jgi:multiple antibiotic resistance protein